MMRGVGGANEMQQVAEHTFHLTHAQVDLMKKSEQYQLQVKRPRSLVPPQLCDICLLCLFTKYVIS